MISNRASLVQDIIENGKNRTWAEYAWDYSNEDDPITARMARYYWEWHLENLNYYAPDEPILSKPINDEVKEEQVDIEHIEETSVEQLQNVLDTLDKYGSLTLNSVWQTKGKGGKIQTLCSWKNNTTDEDIEDFKQSIIDEIKEFSPINKFTPPTISDDKYLAEISFPDFHIGRVSVEESKRLYMSVINKTIERLKDIPLDEIVYVVGHDWLNVDNSEYKTTRGTQQKDVDDFSTTMRAGINIALSSIHELKKLRVPIKVIILPGNHDRFRMEAVGLALEGYFNSDYQVDVDATKSWRKYNQYGENSFMYEHGELKARDYVPAFASERPQLWANTTYRYVRCGHLHHNIEEEFPGLEVTFMPSLSEKSDWEDSKAYISKRRGFIYIHDKNEGEINRIQVKPDGV